MVCDIIEHFRIFTAVLVVLLNLLAEEKRVAYGANENATKLVSVGFPVAGDKTTIGSSIVILEGLNLIKSQVNGYNVRLANTSCPIALQIWHRISPNSYKLRGETLLNSRTKGYFSISASDANQIMIDEDDKLGFSSFNADSSCVPYLFVDDPQKRQYTATIFKRFTTNASPQINDTVIFAPFQTAFQFSLEVTVFAEAKNIQGATGPAGTRGDTGIAGLKGFVGDPGSIGLKGNPGEMGTKGVVGFKGLAGNKGNAGETGITGETGAKGETGPKGILGLIGQIGNPGVLGIQGDTGSRGPTGLRGPQGSIGVQGQKGAAGPTLKGDPGSIGDIGPNGAVGPIGDPGSVGPVGLIGSTGPTGLQGIQGQVGQMWLPQDQDYCENTTKNCSHECENTELGPHCLCPAGHKLVGLTDCDEIDECTNENGGCQYYCTNMVGSFFCHCPIGTMLSNDERRCNDIDECKDRTDTCSSTQLCLNTFASYYCAGPFVDSAALNEASTKDTQILFVTENMVIGLFVWMSILTLIILACIIMLISEVGDEYLEKAMPLPRPRQEFFYPSFFPRISIQNPITGERAEAESLAAERIGETNEVLFMAKNKNKLKD